MADFPGAVPSLPRPTSTTAMNATGYEGDVVIDLISDEVEALATFALVQTINAQTGTTYTVVATDVGKLVTLSNTGSITVTLPQDSDLTFATGKRIDFLVINTGMATFTAGTGATVNATPSAVSRAQWSAVTAIKRAANTWVVVGDLA